MSSKHWAIFIDNTSHKSNFIHSLLNGEAIGLISDPAETRGALFSKLSLDEYMDEEDRHDAKVLALNSRQSLRSMSSGEQKKALLEYILKAEPDFILLDNPFDNLDVSSQEKLKKTLLDISDTVTLIQVISRKEDLLPFITQYAFLNGRELQFLKEPHFQYPANISLDWPIPQPAQKIQYPDKVLIHLKDIHVAYGPKVILNKVNWTIKKGEFWQLIGKNGTGKTTILSMITGENPKGYGQELFIFGKKKGSGESVWDIKKKIGYYTPSMTDKFTGYHTVEHMLISGLNDSIGLYTYPTEAQVRLAREWLSLIGMTDSRNTLFHDLSIGQQRLIMTTRAMVKHPLLLILDEPTAGLDDVSANLLVALVNKMANDSDTSIIFVSHRKEPGLEPNFIFELQPSEEGSIGHIK